MSLPELLRLLPFAPATDRTPDHRFPSMSRNFSGPPDLCPAATPRLSQRNKKTPCELSHSGSTIAKRQLPVTSNSPSSQHEQGGAECQYPGASKISRLSEKSGGIRPRHASQVRAASPGRGYLGPRAAAPPSHARDNPVAWGPGGVPGPAGPRGRRHGRPLQLGPPCGWPAPPRWPRSCRRPTGERPKDSRRARPRQRSSPASNSNGGAGNNHYFSFFKIDVGFPGQVWSSQVREAKSRWGGQRGQEPKSSIA